jgi:hypothetical protein
MEIDLVFEKLDKLEPRLGIIKKPLRGCPESNVWKGMGS